MSYLHNDPAQFAAESAAGFVAAHRRLVRRVEGGVARATRTPDSQVAVVIGGGSGHYPAFAGLVGPGLAHGAAMGNVFASPSAQQIYSVARAVATDAGVLFSYGNYAGDVLNFDAAQDRLRREGIPCETVAVTDDIFSAGPAEREKRRGIAGDLPVFKAAGWAAAQGWPLDRVAAVAGRANALTRSIGVAFSGCTLPGAEQPLFTVPEGSMAVGMGIHGEPGIEVVDLPDAHGLAQLMVSRLLEERPDDAAPDAPVAAVVNGLGSVKGEELFVLYASIAELLGDAGIEIVEPEVGEFATSFEMAGVSLTLTWLDEELQAAWCAPAYSPAYRKGAVALDESDRVADSDGADADVFPDAAPDAVAAGPKVLAAVRAISDVIDSEVDELGRLDAIAGDGDHGIGMQRGANAARDRATQAVAAGAGAGTVLAAAGDWWADRAGGTSGALWGAALRAAGETLGDQHAPTRASVVDAVSAAVDEILRRGGAAVGDKTMVDAIVPFGAALRANVEQGRTLAEAWRIAATEASTAATATADLLPLKGRARPHAEKSLGTPDAGAMSFAMAMAAVGETLEADKNEGEQE